MLKKDIIFFGKECSLCCDGKCVKAWGVNSRPRIKENDKEYFVSDEEFTCAPEDSGTYEGSCGKPLVDISVDMNKWCARECERSVIVDRDIDLKDIKLSDFTHRILIK